MARIYSRKKGKSGSTKPSQTKKKTWVKYDAKEVEGLVVKLSKSGNNHTLIGLKLRDSYGIPSVKEITKKSISKILEDNKIKPEIPEDLIALIRRNVSLASHLEMNKHDQVAKRGLQLTESKINRLVRYYKGTGRLPKDWFYDKSRAKLIAG